MAVILSLLVLLLAVFNYIQFRTQRNVIVQLRYMAEKVTAIVTENTSEKLLMMTEVEELRSLLRAINLLLEHNQKTVAHYSRTEISLRKMLSNISHDLRTPLTVVLGYIETLSIRPEMDERERNKLLSKVHWKAVEVMELINSFFDLAKLESGDTEIPLSRVDMNEVCRNNILSFYDVLTSKGFDVHIDVPAEPLYAHANEEAIDRILNNLLSNAIRYGGDGNMLGLSLRAHSSYVFIDVTDKGKGIQAIYKDQIFERMYTLDDSRNKQFQGSGLGLTITKRLVEKLQGDISVSSKPYDNTTFTVRLKRVHFTM